MSVESDKDVLIRRLTETVAGLAAECELLEAIPVDCPSCGATVHTKTLVNQALVDAVLEDVRRDRIVSRLPCVRTEGSWDGLVR